MVNSACARAWADSAIARRAGASSAEAADRRRERRRIIRRAEETIETPSRTMRRLSAMSVTITGTAQAIASHIVLATPSNSDGSTSAS